MAAPREYPGELRERAVRMAVEARRDPVTRVGALARVGGQLGIDPETSRGCVTQAEVDRGARPGTTTEEGWRVAEPEREVRQHLSPGAARRWHRRRRRVGSPGVMALSTWCLVPGSVEALVRPSAVAWPRPQVRVDPELSDPSALTGAHHLLAVLSQ